MNHEVGARCTDGYRFGTIREQEGVMIRVDWDYGGSDRTWRERGTVRVVRP